MKHLIKTLDDIFGPISCEEKDLIIEAVKMDNKADDPIGDAAKILPLFNEVFDKRSRVISKKVLNRYKQILTIYSIEDIERAFKTAKADDFHIETGHKYCTLEYFSRLEQMDKWESFSPKKEIFQVPKMNLKK